MQKSFCYINGEILPLSKGMISVTDLAFQRAYGVFDFGRTTSGKLFHFEENISRLVSSAQALHLQPPISEAQIFETANQLIAQSNLGNPAIRLILTGGQSEEDDLFTKPNFVIVTEELPTYSEEIFEKGAKVITAQFQRELPHVKTINYMNSIRLEPLKRERGAFDILYHSVNGVTECPRNNFFAFHGNRLITPRENILLGITRRIVLKLASSKFEIEERKIELKELSEIDEAFVTSTTKGVLPVTQIDDVSVGNGLVGSNTKAIMKLFQEYVLDY